MKTALMTMGLPGAGKSYILHRNYDMSNITLIDPDEIKKEHPDYDPKNPSVVHPWSSAEAKVRLAQAIRDGKNIAVDGTGTNVANMVMKIRSLQSAGYTVELVYVKVRLQTAIYRNAHRERTVSEALILEKYEAISTAFELLANEVDKITVINND